MSTPTTDAPVALPLPERGTNPRSVACAPDGPAEATGTLRERDGDLPRWPGPFPLVNRSTTHRSRKDP